MVMKTKIKPELLAPAGDLTRLSYALAYGADAVYAGQPAFSLRARENGFKSLDDLAQGIEICKKQGKKFYLTSNVIARNTKVEAFQKALLAAIELKPDALIVADPGIIGFLRKEAPQQELHLSVQANTTNWLTAKYWADQGIQRIILSRELRLQEVIEIHKQVPEIELEVFVHGAVCMAMSGRCMLSNWVSHRDANQGACNNSCRMPYQLYANPDPQNENYQAHQGNFSLKRTDTDTLDPIALDEDDWGTYFMNSRDLCALDALPDLVQNNTGITSFKVEGRTRSIYYLAQVVHAYRMAIDALYNGENIPEASRRALSMIDSRGWMTGFGYKDPLPQNYQSTREKAELGCVAAQVDKALENHRLQVQIKNPFGPEDSFELLTPQGSFDCKIHSLENAKGEAKDRLHPGTNGSVAIEIDKNIDLKHIEHAFLVKKEKKY